MMKTLYEWHKYRGWKVIAAFQSSIAPHHTTHQMTTKETLLDMRRKFFYNTCPIFVQISYRSLYPVKHLHDVLLSTGTIVSSARSFAMVGFMIVGIECIIETHRCCLFYRPSLWSDILINMLTLFAGPRQMFGMLSMVEVSLEVRLKAKLKNMYEVVDFLLILLIPRLAWSPSGSEGCEYRSLWIRCLLGGNWLFHAQFNPVQPTWLSENLLHFTCITI